MCIRDRNIQDSVVSDNAVGTSTVAEEDDYNYEDDPNYKVDENGCEWWLDDDRQWWFRTPEMDDWMEHTGEQ